MARTLPEIEQIVDGIVRENLGLLVENYDRSHTWQQMGADSLDNVEIVMAMEEKFDIDIIDEVMENIDTPQQAAKAIFDMLGA